MEFLFTNECPASRLDEVVGFLLGPRLWVPSADYPDFAEWAHRAHGELKAEKKRAMIAFAGLAVCGVVIYQRHKRFADALEIKNMTVRPDERGRYVASFLLRNAEIEGAREFGALRAICDAKRSNAAINAFLGRHQYAASATEDLYRLGAGEDVVYTKALQSPR